MRDKQVLHLLSILKSSKCSIWYLNIGEAYNVGSDTWMTFMDGLEHTIITHMYATEKTSLTVEMKRSMLKIISGNHKKHHLYDDPNNKDVTKWNTHSWKNPFTDSLKKRSQRNTSTSSAPRKLTPESDSTIASDESEVDDKNLGIYLTVLFVFFIYFYF